jgi:tRNA threonylcarbamoyladenosine biosynthesis protein TsaB
MSAAMLVLGINTAGEACEAALARGGAVFSKRSELMTHGHDARLAPLVGQLMRDAKVSFEELDRIAVVVGPGSFTGVRVGVAFARGVSLASKRPTPAVGVSSLEALDGAPKDRRVLGLLPAKRRPPEKTWWAQVLEEGRGVFAPVEAQEEELHALAKDVDALCGGLEGVPEVGKPRVPAAPSAAAAALFAASLSGSPPEPRPIYAREPDAKPMARP